VLGIERSASVEEIKHAYRELASKYHPDKLEHLGEEFKVLAEKRFKEIQQAYQELTGKGS
jgi:DnaJ like chaperone protein